MALFTRLTPNTTNWQGPSGSDNKCAGTSLRLFEHRAGFGFEEWYRSPDFRKVDEHGVEWQYGYWQCFKNPNRKTFVPGLYKNFTVYTRECNLQGHNNNTANRIVANYAEIEVLDKNQRINDAIYFEDEFVNIREKLLLFKADTRAFDQHKKSYHLINIRFKLSDENYTYPENNILKVDLNGNRFGVYMR
jgi:hypothetical protein